MSTIVITGTQWGDEGKGKIVDYLAEQADTVVRYQGHVVMPYHRLMDGIGDAQRGADKIGTTGRGIGPCYMDRDDRVGIRVCDLMDGDEFAKKLKKNLARKNAELAAAYDHAPLVYEEVLAEYKGYAERLRPLVTDTIPLINEEIAEGRKILFEGAQATMLDIDYGTYPYVTASHPISGGVTIGAGVAPKKIDTVIGVVKAYCTRVGEGPFPTEQLNDIGEELRRAGHEFGTVTGRPRRTGWLDAVVVRHAGMLSGIDYMAVTRLDILDGFDEIKICTGYRHKGDVLKGVPASLNVLAEVEPIYDALPENARRYLTRMAEVTGIALGIVSVGPSREQTIVLAEKLF